MGFVYLSDRFFLDPKILRVGPDAAMLYLAAVCYSSSQRTNGYIIGAALPVLAAQAGVADALATVQQLIRVGLWSADQDGFAIEATHLWKIESDQNLFDRMRAEARRQHALVIFERDGFVCQVCGHSENLTLDHIIALSRGGSNDPDNLQTLCRSCNSRKGAR